MCDVDWKMLLEYLKVFLGWPLMSLAIAALVIFRFRGSIEGFLQRLQEANILGQSLKAVPPVGQRQEVHRNKEDPLARAVEAQAGADNLRAAGQQAPALPPELENDPQAALAVSYVLNNPAQTVIEYRRLLFNYHSERLFNLIYGTQINLLEFLKAQPDQSATLAQLAPFHEEHQRLAARTDYKLGDYVSFLVGYGVISVTGALPQQIYRLNDNGLNFLSYIQAHYPLNWNLRPF